MGDLVGICQDDIKKAYKNGCDDVKKALRDLFPSLKLGKRDDIYSIKDLTISLKSNAAGLYIEILTPDSTYGVTSVRDCKEDDNRIWVPFSRSQVRLGSSKNFEILRNYWQYRI